MEQLNSDVLGIIMSHDMRLAYCSKYFYEIFKNNLYFGLLIKTDHRNYERLSLKDLEYLSKHNFTRKTKKYILSSIALHDETKLFKTLYKKFPRSQKMLENLIKTNKIELFKWVLYNGYRMSVDECRVLAKTGNLTVFKYILEIGCTWNSHTFYNAVKSGNLELVKLLKTHNCPTHKSVSRVAIKQSNIDMLEYLRDIKCLRNVCEIAVELENIEVLEWGIKNNYRMDEKTRIIAEKYGFY